MTHPVLSRAKRVMRKVYSRLPLSWRRQVTELRRPGRRVLVSVVVPVYNVQEYVGDCLASILAQTHRRLEVIVVDDGSPDRSIDVVNAVAATDPRVRVVRQENAGLGAARNTGVRHARGGMLCFVDSDDSIPPTSVESMLSSLMASGSDFAVGSLMRDTSTGMHMPPWAKQLHDRTRTAVTIADEPEVLKNVFAWTKLFRTEFFRRVVGEFPDGLYEDQVPSAKAYLHGRFDILEDVVCHWRIRDDESSITQQKSTMRDLTGRWTMLDELHEVMRDAPQNVRRAWEAKVVGFDMRPYYEQVPRTDDEYWAFLQREVRAFLDMAGYERLAEVRVADRLLAAATYHGYREDVVELVGRRESQTWKVHGVARDGKVVLGDDYLAGLALHPDGVVERLDDEAEVVSRVARVNIDDRELVVVGSAFLSFVDLAGTRSEITVHAVPADGGEAVAGTVTRFTDPRIDVRAIDPWNDHAESGFRAAVPLKALGAVPYRLEVTVRVDGVERTSVLTLSDVRGAARLPVFGMLTADGRWIVDKGSDAEELVVRRLSPNRVPVRHASVVGRTLTLELAGSLPAARTIEARSGNSTVAGLWTVEDGRTTVTFTLPAAGESGRGRSWTLGVRPARGGRERRFSWGAPSAGLEFPTGTELLVGTTRFGNIVVHTAPIVGEVDDVELVADGLRVRGWAATCGALRGHELSVALVHDSEPGSVAVPVHPDENGAFEATVPVADGIGNALAKSVNFIVTLDAGVASARLRASAGLVSRFPLDLSNGVMAATVGATPKVGSVSMRMRPAFDVEQQSSRAQRKLQRAYLAHGREVTDAVLFESFAGRSVGDSPLALSQELHDRGDTRPQYWSVECLSTPVPAWATPVLRFSSRWYDLLATAGLLVNNNNWPWYFRKMTGQTYLQTWHGTPLKRIGHDVPGANLTVTYRRLMEREAQSWDALLAQNEYSAQIFPTAFGYDGPILVEGYPRNDGLVDGRAAGVRAAARRRLGLSDDVRALLYAPTWRDNIKDGARYGRVAYLDFEALAAATGPGTVVLYRGHANTAASSSDLPDGVLDVTRHPDVNELMLASDALVTDYSSIMFDYAVLRRPIYYLVPDLELYGSKTRGFYADLADIAPGPLCAGTGELVAALDQDYWPVWGAAYDRFVARFAPLDDGQAARRVLDRFGTAPLPQADSH